MQIVSTTLTLERRESSVLGILWQMVLGSFFIALSSYISIPLEPVPITLQTLAIFLLAIAQGGKVAALSLLLFLTEATLGFPVLSGGRINPLWIIGPTAGYLLSFPIVAYLIGKMVEGKKALSSLRIMGSIFCGQCVIYLLGVGWLSYLIGIKKGFLFGLVPFIPGAIFKLLVATSLSGLCLRWKHRFF